MSDELFDDLDFYRFCRVLRIDSKEAGLTTLGDNIYNSQQYVLDRMIDGMKAGVHEFITLKCRQIGISTISLALDMYYVNRYEALPGAIVTHDEASRHGFRTTLALYRAGLPEDFHQEVLDDNRDQLVLANGSRLRFLVAGTRARTSGSSHLGRSGALVLMHATEVAYWGDASGIDALRASFAHKNPRRLYHWESTANGENWFKRMWDEAAEAKSVKQIFCSWWAHDEIYALERGSQLYQAYWDGRLTHDEELLTAEIKERYGIEVNDCQWAWYRYTAAERITDESLLAQEFPHREEDAFIATGSAFFLARTVDACRRYARSVRGAAKHFSISCGLTYADLKVMECDEARSNLTIWEEAASGGWYVIGVDPAFASSEHSDRSCISVWRVYYNRMQQVAEFADDRVTTHAVAWIMVYLAGKYGKTTLNLEVTGPGGAVLQEFQNMRRAAAFGRDESGGASREVMFAIRQYLYRRIDSTTGNATFLHTKTNFDLKERMMNSLRDYIERDAVKIVSEECVEEMPSIRRINGGAPEAADYDYDDRIKAAGLACLAWNDQLRGQLLANGIVWTPGETPMIELQKPNLVQRAVDRHLASIGIVPPGSPPPPPKKALLGQKRWSGKLRDRLERAEQGRSG